MTNQKKFSNFIKDISYYKSVLPVKYKHYFDEISSLYLQRKIEKQSEVHKLLNKLSSRGQSPKSAIKLIESKYKVQAPIIGIKEKIRAYHVSANVEQKLIFKNAYSKEGGYKQNELNQEHTRNKIQIIRETEIIKARNIDEAKDKFKENIVAKFDSRIKSDKFSESATEIAKRGCNNKSAECFESQVDDISFDDVFEESSTQPTTPSTMFLKQSSAINYNMTTSEKKFLKMMVFVLKIIY